MACVGVSDHVNFAGHDQLARVERADYSATGITAGAHEVPSPRHVMAASHLAAVDHTVSALGWAGDEDRGTWAVPVVEATAIQRSAKKQKITQGPGLLVLSLSCLLGVGPRRVEAKKLFLGSQTFFFKRGFTFPFFLQARELIHFSI